MGSMATCILFLVLLSVSSATPLGQVSDFLEELRSAKRSHDQQYVRNSNLVAENSDQVKRAHEEEFGTNSNGAKRAQEAQLGALRNIIKRAHEVEFGTNSDVAKRAQEVEFGGNHGKAKRAHKIELGASEKRAHQMQFGANSHLAERAQQVVFGARNNIAKRDPETELGGNNDAVKRAHVKNLGGSVGAERRAHEIKLGGPDGIVKRAHKINSDIAKRAFDMLSGMNNKFAKRTQKDESEQGSKFAKRTHEVQFGGDNDKNLRDQRRADFDQEEIHKKREQASSSTQRGALSPSWNMANRETHSFNFKEGATKRNAPGESACEVEGPIQMLNEDAGTYLNIFSEISVPCDGRISHWDYYAQGPGVFYASIWRPKASNRFELVGSNRISASSRGSGSFEVPFDDRIMVTEGLVLGIFYPKDIEDQVSGGVVPYDDSRYPGVLNSQSLSPIHNSASFAEDLIVGSEVESILPDIRRQPALSFFVAPEEENPLMTLGYSAEPGDELDEWVHATYITDPSQSASKPGKLVGWNLYVQNVLPIALQIWRPLGDNRYQMISETWVHPSEEGPMHVDLGINCARCRKVSIRPGDTLGFYFPDKAVIPFTRYSPCNDYNAHRYYEAADPSGAQRAEEGDAIEFKVAPQEWGACREYAYSAEILLDEEPTPAPTPSTGGGGGGGASGCGVPQITPNVENRIVGGIPAIAHSWPWMVSLQSDSGFHYCGGSLIDTQWVITAAHCMPFSSSDKVVLGMHNKQHSSGVEIHIGAEDFVYPGYDSFTNDADVALLKLERPVDIQREISPVCLPNQGENFRTGKSGNICYTTGWGDLESWGASPDTLMQVEVPLVDQTTCNQADWYDGEVTDNMVCAGYEEGGKDSCQGDSGGPLICIVDGQWKLTGVVSWGYGCARPKKPGIYAKTANFVDWVQETMRNN